MGAKGTLRNITAIYKFVYPRTGTTLCSDKVMYALYLGEDNSTVLK